MSLGEDRAAAAVAFLAFVQYLGEPQTEAQTVLAWANLVTDLDPRAYEGYYFAGVFSFADERVHQPLDALLARGQREFPESFDLPLLRAFAAHFGARDLKRAAYYYRQASAKPGAPNYLRPLADRLESDATSCSSLYEFAVQQERGIGLTLLTSCIKRQIELAAATYRLRHAAPAPDVATLQAAGLLGPLPPLPHVCWVLGGATAVPTPC